MSEVEKNTEPRMIVRQLQRALLEQQLVEVRINRRPRIFYTHLLDHPPAPEDSSAPLAVGAAKYQPGSFLNEQQHVLIAPLEPPLGNLQIRTSHEVTLCFFQGVKSYEMTLFFQSLVVMGEITAIRLSFPEMMEVNRKRRHFRAEVPRESGTTLTVRALDVPEFEATLADISAGGLAFYQVIDPARLPLGTVLTLHIKDVEEICLTVRGVIRTCAKALYIEKQPEGSLRFGVQIDLESEKIAMCMDELTAMTQRRYLQAKAKTRPPEDGRDEKKSEEEPPLHAVEELKKFLHLKKDFHLF